MSEKLRKIFTLYPKQINKENLNSQRKFIFISIFAISLFGLLMIYESSSIHALKTVSDPAYFFKKQALFLFIALILFFLTLLLDLEFIKKYNKEFLLITILFLIWVILFGKKAGGAKRWISLWGFNIQPSEILKISFLLYCADYYSRKRHLIKKFKSGLLPLGIILGSICLLLLMQPDLGTAVFWVIWSIFFLFLFGARKKYLISIIIIGLIAAFFLIKLYPYRFRRIIAYFDPFSYARGAGFQLIQSQIAFGIGGIWGVGLGEGIQKLSFLPAAHTDFIFSIVAEEFGLWGSLGLMGLFLVIFHKMFGIAQIPRDEFRTAILWGIIFIFFLEITINIAVSCGLFPTKGLPLPFMSYGGSNLVVHYVLLGLFFNASRVKK